MSNWGNAPHGYPPPSHGYAPAPVGYVQGWTCRCCGYVGVPARTSRVSTAGWIVAIVLALTCAGLLVAWVPLVAMTTQSTICPRCRTPHGTV